MAFVEADLNKSGLVSEANENWNLLDDPSLKK
jgi:hypothetical protein